MGNTPTGVGKTHPLPDPPCQTRKHPHGRGEDAAARGEIKLPPETPPRAWGRRHSASLVSPIRGNTPTGVGKTSLISMERRLTRKHPHGRGEDASPIGSAKPNSETPPRAWGRPAIHHHSATAPRNTPTGVGKTAPAYAPAYRGQKHPHGRGEDQPTTSARRGRLETPPRAWGRPKIAISYPPLRRNTPTGVGKTILLSVKGCRRQKHPHGRGEDQGWQLNGSAHQGNTPTGVGKTANRSAVSMWSQKHPHGRGEDRVS